MDINTIQIEVVNHRTDLYNDETKGGYYGKRGYFKVREEIADEKINCGPQQITRETIILIL